MYFYAIMYIKQYCFCCKHHPIVARVYVENVFMNVGFCLTTRIPELQVVKIAALL